MKAMMITQNINDSDQFIELLCSLSNDIQINEYESAYTALTSILVRLPQVVFLDVKTEDYDGLLVARQIKQERPTTHIVFVTTNKQHALEAFEIGATDYLTPPFNQKRLAKTIQRICPIETLEQNKHVSISCFGPMTFTLANGETLTKIKWRTKKAQEVFAYFLLNNGKELRKDVLVDLFWPHLEWNQGMNALYMSIYQIRKVLDQFNMNFTIDSAENMYIAHLNDTQDEMRLWEQHVNRIDQIDEQNVVEALHTIHQYKGDYLGVYPFEWAEIERIRLRTLWLQLVRKVVYYFKSKGQREEATKIYHYVQMICPEEESAYFALMIIYNKLGDHNAVMATYQALKKVLQDHADSTPSRETEEWMAHYLKTV